MTTFKVQAYLLVVEHQLRDWPEKGQRVTRWMAPARAARLVGEDGLVQLLLRLDAPPARRGRRPLRWPGRRSARASGLDATLAGLLASIARLGKFWERAKRRA